MFEMIKNVLQFVFICGIVLGVGAAIFARSCWDRTSESADRTIREFYADGGPHDQIMNIDNHNQNDTGIRATKKINHVIRHTNNNSTQRTRRHHDIDTEINNEQNEQQENDNNEE